ncbi:MAG TPA: AarF/UbiB family protein [Kofleriaceae bacterium]|nr:AarF/UbiB family protein [Kofleriaceae bacterium]
MRSLLGRATRRPSIHLSDRDADGEQADENSHGLSSLYDREDGSHVTRLAMPRMLDRVDRRSESQRLRHVRDELDLTQRQLAELFGVAASAIAQWESGQHTIPGPVLRLLELYEREMGLGEQTVTKRLPFEATTRTARVAAASVLWLVFFGALQESEGNPLLRQVREASLRRVTRMLGELKGLAMKLGQMISYADVIMTERERAVLSMLQTDTKPMSAAAVCQVFVQELGKTPRQLFATWSADPIATASIGQVHEARLADGRSVAVKVQYPRIVQALEIDLGHAARFDRALALFFRGQQHPIILDELRARILEECDYTLEASNQGEAARAFAARSDIRIAGVIPELSSRRILTSELLAGAPLLSFVKTASASARERAALALLDFYFQGLFLHRFFHTDPAPTNFLFTDEHVCFLDFGRIKRFSQRFVDQLKQMLRAILSRDRDGVRAMLIDMGAVPDPHTYDFDYAYRALLHVHRPFLGEGAFAYTAEHLRKMWHVFIYANPNRSRINITPDMVFLNQFYFGVTAMLVRLGARVDYRARLLDLLYGPDEQRPAPFTDAEQRALLEFG